MSKKGKKIVVASVAPAIAAGALGAADVIARLDAIYGIPPSLRQMAVELAQQQAIGRLAQAEVSRLEQEVRAQCQVSSPPLVSLRCHRALHAKVARGAVGRIEIACRHCRPDKGRTTLHTFDLATGALLDTRVI